MTENVPQARCTALFSLPLFLRSEFAESAQAPVLPDRVYQRGESHTPLFVLHAKALPDNPYDGPHLAGRH